jgi:outer membrane receptor protein involved in Fe transport
LSRKIVSSRNTSRTKSALFAAAAVTALFALPAASAQAADDATTAAAAGDVTVGELVVTAQKREENINNVGMSITAATGDKLTQLGIHDTSDLQKIVPGFQSTPTYYGTNVFTIRGVGFQDTSLAGNPTVSVYIDEAPLPFSALTNGATLDLQRVEVLKGPQGTLFGENATGGAINYIANKPTDHFSAGVDASYGRFNDADISGFINGPLTDTLDARLAGRYNSSGPWQQGYGPNNGQTIGGKDFLNGRLSFLWRPTSKFRALLTLNAWQDKGYTQMGQLYGVAELSPLAPLAPSILNYPLAPHNDQAAGFMNCVNNSPYDPIANQSGAVSATGPLVPTNQPGVFESQGPGSTVQAGGQPTSCEAPRKNNTFFSSTLRMDYDLGNDITVTSLTAFERFSRHQAIDGAGMDIQDYQSVQHGKITSIYQELRIAGKFWGKGNWVIGGNYQHDNTWDQFLQTYNASTASPTLFAYDPQQPFSTAFGLPLGPTKPTDVQENNTYAVFGHLEYPILDNLTVLGGVRFTEADKIGGVCGNDGGDGTWANVGYLLQIAEGSTSPVLSPAGACASTGSAANNFNSPPNGELFYAKLDQNNVAWQAGLNYKVTPDTLLYVTISQGYKGGSFPTIALATINQVNPVVQEGLLSYEVGFKSSLMHHQLQANGAFFYYDYTDKQILGAVSDRLFGALPSLVNVPKSHVIGFELSGAYAPDWLRGLTVTPAISYQYSRIDTSSKNTCAPPAAQSNPALPGYVNCVAGDFYNFDAFNQYADFTHEAFPAAPAWQGSVDAEYDWVVHNDYKMFFGTTVNFVSSTNSFFVNRTPIPAYYNGPTPIPPSYNGTGFTYLTCGGAPSVTPVGPCPTNHPNDPLAIPGYVLVDLRLGVSHDKWMFQLWGRNVGNTWYWLSADHVNDVLLHYTGMPATWGGTFSYRF